MPAWNLRSFGPGDDRRQKGMIVETKESISNDSVDSLITIIEASNNRGLQ